MSFRDTLREAVIAPWMARAGIGDPTFKDFAWTNKFQTRMKAATAGLQDILGIGSDANNNLLVGTGVYTGPTAPVVFNLKANGSLATQAFYISDGYYAVTGISEVHSTLGTDPGTVSITVTKATGTQSPTQGVSLMSGVFNAKATINTIQNATLVDPNPASSVKLNLAPGDRLCIVFTGVLTALAGVEVTVQMAPGGRSIAADYVMNANASISTTSVITANEDYVVSGVKAIWSTAGTDPGAVTLDVTKDTGTNAPGAGTSVLSATISLKGTANTVNSGALTATAATLRLAPGDRVAVKITGTTTALAGLVVMVYLQSVSGKAGWLGVVDVPFTLKATAALSAQNFFTADRPYELKDMSCVFSVADGAVNKVGVTKDTGTTAPGAGSVLQTDNSNAGFDVNATANTVQFATLVAQRLRYLLPGDRLGLLFAAGVTNLAGLEITVTLIPR